MQVKGYLVIERASLHRKSAGAENSCIFMEEDPQEINDSAQGLSIIDYPKLFKPLTLLEFKTLNRPDCQLVKEHHHPNPGRISHNMVKILC